MLAMTVMTSDARVELAQRLADASRDVEALRLRLQNARSLALERADKRELIERLTQELREAEARQAAASEAVTTTAREAREALWRSQEDARNATMDAARAVVAEMLPVVERIVALNHALDALRATLGNPSGVPPSFRPHLLTVERWLEHSQQFVGDRSR
jgi:hypothetical protein